MLIYFDTDTVCKFLRKSPLSSHKTTLKHINKISICLNLFVFGSFKKISFYAPAVLRHWRTMAQEHCLVAGSGYEMINSFLLQ